jgi:hypothetical protein
MRVLMNCSLQVGSLAWTGRMHEIVEQAKMPNNPKEQKDRRPGKSGLRASINPSI